MKPPKKVKGFSVEGEEIHDIPLRWCWCSIGREIGPRRIFLECNKTSDGKLRPYLGIAIFGRIIQFGYLFG